MTRIRLGGVPEHFNLPIHLAEESGKFSAQGIDLDWTFFKGGTGQMTKALRENEIDTCVLLTEGVIKDIVRGNPSKIISVYVNTPLTWGIHTGAKNSLKYYADIYDKKYAISRFGSGSHLMAIVDAYANDRTIKEDQFHIIKNLDGALNSLEDGDTDVFYWEKYTTKPYVDAGTLRRVGEYKTPWPCFVIAARDEAIEKMGYKLDQMLRVIHQSCADFMELPEASQMVAERYGLKPADAASWYHSTEWATHGWVSNKMLQSVVFNLRLAGILGEAEAIPDLVWRR